ncbi:hypothetical protein LCGC14_1594270, partial [marine sediment metagenome]
DGATVTFAFSWKVWETSEVKVILRLISDGSETVLTEGTGASSYSVTLSSELPSAGSITTVTTYSNLYEIVIKAAFPYIQEVDYGEGDKFPAKSHEEALDRGVRLSQQFTEQFGRSLLFPESTTLEDVELPEISASNAGFFLGVNSAGSAIQWAEPTDLGNLTSHDEGQRESIHQNMLADLVADTNTSSPGMGLVAPAAEVATGNEATKIVSPLGLASVWQYDTIQVPAGSLRPSQNNAGTQNIQEYSTDPNEATTTRDYVEFGTVDPEDPAAYDVTLWMPETWDQTTLKAKFSWMASYETFLAVGSAIAIGIQTKAYNAGSPIAVNWSTPPIYVTDTVTNQASDTEEETAASANISSSVSDSTNRIDLRITRDNSISNNATAEVWLTQLLLQFKRNKQVTGW